MVKLHLLGPTELTRSDGRDLSGVLTRRKELALLAYLALKEPWSFCRRETLAGLLWPDSSESRARASLSVALHHLRQLLGRRVLLGRGSEEIGVDPDELWVDVRALLEAVDRGDFREAGELYRGPLLEGFHVTGASSFTIWLEGERTRLRLLVVDSLTGLADSVVEADPAEACRWARRATTLAPHDQKAHASLIRALARSSHQAEALQVLGALQDRLRADLDLEPAGEIRALEQQLRTVDDGFQPQAEASPAETDPDRSHGVVSSGGGGEAREAAAADDPLEGSVHPSDAISGPAHEASGVGVRKGFAVGAAAALALAFGAWALGVDRAETLAPEVERYELAFRDGQAPTPRTGNDPVGNLTLALSPGGSRLVYVRREDDGTRRLWLRPRARESASPLVGTEGARTPFFSPDGSSLGFLTSRPDPSLRVVPADGGPPLTLVGSNVQDDSGATWGPDGYIYYIDVSTNLRRVPDTGGVSEVVREPDRSAGISSLGFPEALPNGRGVLMTLMRGLGEEGTAFDSVGVLDLRSGEMRTLVRGLRATFLPPDFLIFTTVDGAIMAAEFDQDRLQITGPEIPIVAGLGMQLRSRLVNLTLSPSGRMIYEAETSLDATIEPIWVDRSGSVTPVEPGWTIEAGRIMTVSLSPGDRRIAIGISSPHGATAVVIKDLGGGSTTLRLGGTASWSRDGSRLLVAADTSGRANYDVWSVASDGIGAPELLADLDQPIANALWEADDETLLVRTSFLPSATVLRMDSDGQVDSLLASDSVSYTAPALSPDGRYLAYVSSTTGRPEIHVRTYPGMDRGWTISNGGREPVWSHDGRRLYFKSLPDDPRSVPAQLWSVTFDPGTDPPVGARAALFPLPEGVSSDGFFAGFDVTEDDERFLMYRSSIARAERSRTTYHVVNGFREEVRTRINR